MAMALLLLISASGPVFAQHYVAAADTSFPKVQYPDSLTSLNDRCAVRMTKLALKMRPVYVNGYPIGFC